MLREIQPQALHIAALLRARGEKVAVADGATGGLLAASLLITGHAAGVLRNLAEARRLDSSQPTDRRESCVLNLIRGLIRWSYESAI